MQYQSLCILGRLPALGRAELESLYGADQLQPVGDYAMLIDRTPSDIDFRRLGGSTRLARVLGTVDSTHWNDLAKFLTDNLTSYLDALPAEGKLKLGVSTFGLAAGSKQLFRTGLELKKVCKKAGRSVRLVPNTEPALSSAQVLHNQLAGDLGLELLLVADDKQTIVAKTMAVQDITAYAHRDQGRPKRDARVGMLPPKLAQTIVNLATGSLPVDSKTVVLDPFCGTGVVLQEALLMGFGAYGTDLEPRMIDFTEQNLSWLLEAPRGGSRWGPPAARSSARTEGEYGLTGPPTQLEVGDATSHRWRPFSVVASETYLGRPLSSWPNSDTLHEIMGACNTIIEKTLQNLASQTSSGTRLCLAVPAWRGPGGTIHHLQLLDHLSTLGYNRIRFEHAAPDQLVYYRPEQLVARELLVITRI